jgi:type IV pilus assembly protein PilB
VSLEFDTPARAHPPFEQLEGVTPPSPAKGRRGFLSDVIVEMGFAERDVVDEVVDQSRLVGKVAEEILVENGWLNEEQLARAIAERNGLPFVDLSSFAVDDGARRLIGIDTAVRYRAVPIAFDADGALVVALADPLDALAVSDIGVIAKSQVRTAVATDAAIGALLAEISSRAPVRLAPEPDDAAEPSPSQPETGGEWNLSNSISTTGAVEPGSEQLATALEEATAEIERLTARVEELERERDELRAERDPAKPG